MKPSTPEIPPNACCPHCGEGSEAYTPVTTEQGEEPAESPEVGSYSICIYCGEIGVYQDDLTIRKMTNAELRDENVMAPLQRIQGLVKEFINSKK